MEGRREEKKGAHACMGGCTCWETVRVCVDNRVHDSTCVDAKDVLMACSGVSAASLCYSCRR